MIYNLVLRQARLLPRLCAGSRDVAECHCLDGARVVRGKKRSSGCSLPGPRWECRGGFQLLSSGETENPGKGRARWAAAGGGRTDVEARTARAFMIETECGVVEEGQGHTVFHLLCHPGKYKVEIVLSLDQRKL